MGEFINTIDAAHKLAMDLNAETRHRLASNLKLLRRTVRSHGKSSAILET
jgi:hypothetical protein